MQSVSLIHNEHCNIFASEYTEPQQTVMHLLTLNRILFIIKPYLWVLFADMRHIVIYH